MEYIRLHNGVSIPQLGIGGFAQKADALESALKIGYRLIDTAAQYGNEDQVGRAIKNSGIPRSEIFVSTKLWTSDIRKNRTKAAFFESLERLQMDYVDLYLIHWPAEGFAKAWCQMEELYADGKVKAIGVSNCNIHHLEDIRTISDEIPVVNQIESHPYFNNQKLIDYCREHGIAVEAWCPLGGSHSHLLEDSRLKKLAEEYGKTPAQIVLRWHMQREIITFPKSSHEDRMRSNFEVFDFELKEKDITLINEMNTGKRMGADPDTFDF